VTDADDVMRFTNNLPVYPDPALGADPAGKAPALKKTGMPQPLVESYAAFFAQENLMSFSFAKGEFSSIGTGLRGF
jgi:hypothetical protein